MYMYDVNNRQNVNVNVNLPVVYVNNKSMSSRQNCPPCIIWIVMIHILAWNIEDLVCRSSLLAEPNEQDCNVTELRI